MKVLGIGNKVKIGTGTRNIPAEITAVCIRGKAKHITYEVSWYHEGNRKCEWLNEFEIDFEPYNSHELDIGFR